MAKPSTWDWDNLAFVGAVAVVCYLVWLARSDALHAAYALAVPVFFFGGYAFVDRLAESDRDTWWREAARMATMSDFDGGVDADSDGDDDGDGDGDGD